LTQLALAFSADGWQLSARQMLNVGRNAVWHCRDVTLSSTTRQNFCLKNDVAVADALDHHCTNTIRTVNHRTGWTTCLVLQLQLGVNQLLNHISVYRITCK